MNELLGFLIWISPALLRALYAAWWWWLMKNAPDAEDIGHD